MTTPDRLADCGSRPNCVSSTATNPKRRVGPWRLAAAPEVAWAAIRDIVTATPRVTVVEATERYLHAEARSRIFGFVDDLELLLEGDELAVRSASRVGYSDRGVNRRRVEALRLELVGRGLIQP
jgi:uncharacterized protein (DUF1499 family)